MVELFVEDYPFGFRKIDDFETIAKAEKEMLDRYDEGLHEDFMIKDSGMEFRYPSYKLCFAPCRRCGEDARVYEMQLTHDYHGIPYRSVCPKCYDAVQRIGYDGVKYGIGDENLDYDY